MYKIIGGDQREYGPVSADEIRRWINEGRLNGRSVAKATDAAEWQTLASFPEFAEALRAQAGVAPTGTASSPQLYAEAWTAEILARDAQVRVGECLSRSWQLMTRHYRLLLSGCALVWLAGLCQHIPFMGSLLGLLYDVMMGVFYGGLYLVFLKTIRGEKTNAGEAFSGFHLAFGQLLLAGFLSWLLARIGLCFCILPWIYLTVAWVFAVPLVADKRLEFWPAMELSRKVVSKVWFEMLALMLVAFIPVILAGIYEGVKLGTLLAPPILNIARSGSPDPNRMVQTVLSMQGTILTLKFMTRVVLLLNMPFAVGALMYAYENLFGPRTPASS